MGDKLNKQLYDVVFKGNQIYELDYSHNTIVKYAYGSKIQKRVIKGELHEILDLKYHLVKRRTFDFLNCYKMENVVLRLGKDVSSFIYSIQEGDNEHIHLIKSIVYKDKGIKMLCKISDVSEINELEEMFLTKTEEELKHLRDSSLAKTKFISDMSHDIRTPLNGIIGLTKISYSYLDNRVKIKENLDKITLASNHLYHLINNVLDISRIESGKISLDYQVFNLAEFFNNIRTICEINFQNKNQTLIINSNQNLDYYVNFPRLRLEEIIINLLNNAQKFSSPSKRVWLNIKVFNPKKEFLDMRLEVQDEGIGISNENIDKIFNTYERVDERIEGFGLGLSICHKLVKLMGGKIECESELGKGSIFRVTVSLPIVNEVKHNITSTLRETFKGKKILIVDDNEINKEIATELLKNSELIIDLASDGEAAVEMFEGSPLNYYDLVFMDVRMPKIDGYQATRLIRGLGRVDAQSVPIVAMTANAFNEDKIAAINNGMNNHIAKPFNLQTLLEILNMYL